MFPHIKIIGLSLYDIMLSLGIVAALLVYYICIDRRGAGLKFEITTLGVGCVSIIFGSLSALLLQAVYTYTESGVFDLRNSASTFYGGLLGGAAVFFALYFTLCKKICGNEIKDKFTDMAGAGFCAVTVAHSIGRLGCFFVGCCHGVESDYGIYLPAVGKKVLPTQLYESIFLAVLFAVMLTMYIKKKGSPVSVYLIFYGIFRFAVEFLRGDERGEFIPFLTPSQFWAAVSIILGVCISVYEWRRAHRKQ